MGNIAFSASIYARQRNRAQDNFAWEEYRESVHDHLTASLQEVEEIARQRRRSRNNPNGKPQQLRIRDLDECMNIVTMAYAKTDEREASIFTD